MSYCPTVKSQAAGNAAVIIFEVNNTCETLGSLKSRRQSAARWTDWLGLRIF
jgi:hypothetical protein